jgi:hypothetical protein
MKYFQKGISGSTSFIFKKKEEKKPTLKNFEKHTGWLLTFVEVYI